MAPVPTPSWSCEGRCGDDRCGRDDVGDVGADPADAEHAAIVAGRTQPVGHARIIVGDDDAHGPVVEPLKGVDVAPFGKNLELIAPWPWAVASVFGQIILGFAFIGIMYWYARWERKRGVKA